MNWEHAKADWAEVKGKVKATWGKLTDDDVKLIEGKWDQLVGKLRHRYGYDKDRAEQEVDQFLKSVQAKGQDGGNHGKSTSSD
jgi:uncharacterized protein YjbJ (UPF0337 family)